MQLLKETIFKINIKWLNITFVKNKYMYQYIAKRKYILKMIQIIITFDKVPNHVYWIWIDCTFSIPYEKFHSCDFTKKHMDEVFHSNKHNYVLKNCWKISTFIWKITRIMLKAFVSKSILHIYQNSRWNQRQTTPKII
jgi:hypothetical protein